MVTVMATGTFDILHPGHGPQGGATDLRQRQLISE